MLSISTGWKWLLFVVVALFLSGCSSDTITQQQRESAKAILEKGLNAWKSGEDAKKWTDEKASPRFLDDNWSKGSKLVSYEIVRIKGNVDAVPIAYVKLTIQPAKGGDQVIMNAEYGINLEKQIVSRDPMT